jgi:prophage regulatory protein
MPFAPSLYEEKTASSGVPVSFACRSVRSHRRLSTMDGFGAVKPLCGFVEATIRHPIGPFRWKDSRAYNHEGIIMTENLHRPIATILRMTKVKARTGLSRSTIYLKIKAGAFPAQVSLGPRAVGWLEDDIERWIAMQVERSRNTAPATKG